MRPLRALVPFAILVLAACSVLPKAETPNIYLLPATPLPASTASPTNLALRVAAPSTPRTLEGTRVAVVPETNVITAYKGSRWSDNVPSLLRDRILDAFRDDGRIARLSTDEGNLHADLELGGDLRAFQSEYRDGAPVVVIRYDARLVDARTEYILATRTFTITQPASGKEIPQVIVAFGQASDALSAQMVAWTIEQSAPRPDPIRTR
jgi:cholesterol transport system auxiliary component